MDEATRAEALEKLKTFEGRIGYPSKWRDYSAFASRTASGRERANGRAFEWRRLAGRLGQPVDRSEWEMTRRPSTLATIRR